MRWHNLDPILDWGIKRINKNQNCIIIINGSTGSGKTYSGLEIAAEFAKIFKVNFSVKNNLDFDFENLLKKMDLEENQGKGIPYVFEEVGVVGGGGASNEWQSKANAFFNSFMQTARHLNQILIFTCPNFHNLDKRTRELVHCQLITNGINHRNRVCLINPYFLQVNPTSAKIYRKRVRFIFEGIKYKLTGVQVKHPPKELVHEYEKIKKQFTDELRKRITGHKKVNKTKPKTDIEIVRQQLEEGYTNKKIAELNRINVRTVIRIKKKLGYDTKKGNKGGEK